jgi:DNA-binding MarR family transcriptional regulator
MTAPGHLIRRAEQVHRTLWSQYVGDSLTSAQFAILVSLERRPEVDQRTLAESVSLDSSTLADVCRRLEERGLIERSRDAADGRRYTLRSTADGARLRRELTAGVRRVGTELLDGMSDRQRDTLLTLLTRVVAHERSGR